MESGKLRHKLTLQSKTNVRTASGGFTETWTTVETLWGSVKPTAGDESEAGSEQQARITHEVTVRHYAGVNAGMRLLFGSRALNIERVINSGERDRMLKIRCVESV